MVERISTPSGIVYYRSTLIPAKHAFSTRVGGISQGPYASLNFGNPGDAREKDSPANIAENYRRLCEATGITASIVRVHQVHGALVVDGVEAREKSGSLQADAIVSGDPGVAPSVRTADCIPILLSDFSGRHVAAIHAGWRGVADEIVLRAAEAICNRASVDISGLRACIGPGIGQPAFEVGDDVAKVFDAKAWAQKCLVSAGKKWHIDLKLALANQLASIGFRPEQVDISQACSHECQEEFFSHRRDKGLTGRMVAVIQPAT